MSKLVVVWLWGRCGGSCVPWRFSGRHPESPCLPLPSSVRRSPWRIAQGPESNPVFAAHWKVTPDLSCCLGQILCRSVGSTFKGIFLFHVKMMDLLEQGKEALGRRTQGLGTASQTAFLALPWFLSLCHRPWPPAPLCVTSAAGWGLLPAASSVNLSERSLWLAWIAWGPRRETSCIQCLVVCQVVSPTVGAEGASDGGGLLCFGRVRHLRHSVDEGSRTHCAWFQL